MGVMHSDEGGGDLQLMVETESQLSEASHSSMTKERNGMTLVRLIAGILDMRVNPIMAVSTMLQPLGTSYEELTENTSRLGGAVRSLLKSGTKGVAYSAI